MDSCQFTEAEPAAMPHKFNHARRHKFEKAKYRLRNWPSYDAGLRRRGDVRLWISEEAIAGWSNSGACTSPSRTCDGERG